MANKTNHKRPIHKTFLFNLGVILLICVAIYWILFAFLGKFTRHGQSVEIPKVIGLNFPEAKAQLKNRGLNIDVDSTYIPGKAPLAVINQEPNPGFRVKKGHTISLTINKRDAPSIPMPSLINLSYRSALMVLNSNKLLLKDTIMRPDMAKGAVLAQLINGEDIAPGASIPQGSALTLVIGSGSGQTKMNVPNIVGLSYPEAVALISGSNLNYQVIFDGEITDTLSAIVSSQSPEAISEEDQTLNTINEGSTLSFHVQQNAINLH